MNSMPRTALTSDKTSSKFYKTAWGFKLAPSLNILAVFALVGLLGLPLGCSNPNPRPVEETPDRGGPTINVVSQAATDHGLKERYLLTAAFVQSNFGLDTKERGQNLTDSQRASIFGLAVADMSKAKVKKEGDTALAEQANFLAEKTATLAQSRNPKSDFDWYLLLAQAIVGESETDPNLRDFSARIVLLQLVSAHNSGYTVLLPKNERTVVEPATDDEKIDLKKLDQGQLRYVNNFKFSADTASDAFVKGDPKAEIEVKDGKDYPKIVLRMCPASSLTCFDHLRKSEQSSAHFLSFKGLNGVREVIQFHDVKKDLNFYGKSQKNTITIVISGMPGLTPGASRLDFMGWDDYVAVRQTVLDVMSQASRVLARTETDAKLREPEFLNAHVVEALRDNGNFGEVPEDKPDFLLPDIWDKSLFREILNASQPLRDVSQVRVESPNDGQVFAGTEAFFAFYPDRESAQFEIYQDNAKGIPGAPWDLVLKQDFNPGQERYEMTREFRYPGFTRNKLRAVKIVARRGDGSILGSHVVRFRVDGLP